jgi:hypothetical protein
VSKTFLEKVRSTRNPFAFADQQADRNAGPQEHRQKAARKDRQEARRENQDLARGRRVSSEDEG